MKAAEAFAEKLPLFKNYILEKKLDGMAESYKFGNRYKSIPLDWGINRYFYGGPRKITNYNYEINDDYTGYLFEIYINSISLFGEHYNFDLFGSIPKELYFFFDKLNTRFYIKDESIEGFLEALNDWYVKAKSEVEEYRKRKEIEELEKRLTKLKGETNE